MFKQILKIFKSKTPITLGILTGPKYLYSKTNMGRLVA